MEMIMMCSFVEGCVVNDVNNHAIKFSKNLNIFSFF